MGNKQSVCRYVMDGVGADVPCVDGSWYDVVPRDPGNLCVCLNIHFVSQVLGFVSGA